MPWGRLDDSFYDHPKVEHLPVRVRNACVGLWARCISWSNRYLTDGFIPHERIRKLDGDAKLAEALVLADLFEHHPDGYLVHDYLDYNDSAADVRRRREEMRELGRAGGKRSGQSRRADKAKRDASTVDEAARLNSRPSPVPSRPVPAEGSAREDEEPEGDALSWLARHGCYVRPGNGYHQKLVLAVENHGVNAVVGMFDRLAGAGVLDGDTKGFVFGAIDALNPKVDLARQERQDEDRRHHEAELARTRRLIEEDAKWRAS